MTEQTRPAPRVVHRLLARVHRHLCAGADIAERWKVELEDEGDLADLLGIEFFRGEDTIELKQTKYIEKLAAEFFADGVPPTS